MRGKIEQKVYVNGREVGTIETEREETTSPYMSNSANGKLETTHYGNAVGHILAPFWDYGLEDMDVYIDNE